MPKFNVKVVGDKKTNATLHSRNRMPFPIPGAKSPNGKDLDRPAGDYIVSCITQFGTEDATVTCTVSGANDTKRTISGDVDQNGRLTLARDFRLTDEGEVR